MDIHVSPQIERLIRDSFDEDIGAGDLGDYGDGRSRVARQGIISRQERRRGGRLSFA